ncbi:hypothetical protein COO91_03107 [Nostoc flagelliforme CCNUN1]|uniref:Uncharacterized protein n=1 Tax=Nostoc flagelliforme CCNUN1 TaxID=2038116 RepID=A0A2K8SP03_9NOSO|nr:hypothetical protein COO91_03107 [Nostoc flagelliforme CCNUN1]
MVFRLYRMSLLSFAPGTSLNSSSDLSQLYPYRLAKDVQK